ncbi:MAG: Mrp/NBP35 family ATP-binding protein [Actinomycetota bacterium]|nr:Mrp/NBP35 family ATP-binding protein [Actinomycetota bacterium]
MAVEERALERAVAAVVDRELDLTLGEAGMVHSVDVRRHRAEVVLALPVSPWPSEEELRQRVAEAAAAVPGIRETSVGVGLMADRDRDVLRSRLRRRMAGDALTAPPGEAAEGPAHGDHGHGDHGHGDHGHGDHGHGAQGRPTPSFLQAGSKTRVVGISSGKGGVGKSSVTVNLAIALSKAGQRVGILDADVYGFSIPKMVGADHDPAVIGDMVVPAVCHGVRVLSMGFFVPDDTPVIWRGPMLHKAIEQFLSDAYWGDPDVLLVDMPPGTGDVTLSLAQFMTRAEILVVTTPQPAAQRVAQRSAFAARKLKLSVRGVIENMSWFTADDGTRYELFGRGGGQALADDLAVPLLGQVPLVPGLREGGDEGVPVALREPDGEAARAFDALAAALLAIGPARVYRRELSVR